MTGVAVVTVAHGRHDHLRAQHESLAGSSRPPDVYVVVAIGDPAIETLLPPTGPRPRVLPIAMDRRGLPLAAARNRGIDLAQAAGCDELIGLDVDCLAGADMVEAYADAVRSEPHRLWSGPVTYLGPSADGGCPLGRLDQMDAPHPGRPAPQRGDVLHGGDPELFWSLSYAVSGAGWQRIGGFDEAYLGYGAEDTDFGRRAAVAGIEMGWVGAARAYHQHHPVSRPPIEHLDDILRNGRTYRDRWGEWPMYGGLEEFEQLGLIRRRGADYERVGTGH